ncbi:MAG: hypothetical protein MUF59_09670 [Candidatus Krumholzibacteria bacterium]|nr:hypothetical protein [Candidatus Krumholzibacteria bacterium]
MRDGLKKLLSFAAVSAAVLSVLPGPVFPSGADAAGGELPSGESICDRFVEVSGGIEAFGLIRNRVTKMTIEMAAQGLKLEATVYAAAPGRFYSIVESPAIGRIERGVSGDVVWERSLMTGPSVKEGEERAMMLRETAFDRNIHWRKAFKSAECTGIEKIGGTDCYRVVMTPAEGEPHIHFYEKESGLLARVESIVHSSMGAIPQVSSLGDYRETDGVLVSWSVALEIMGQHRSIKTVSIEHNVEMPEGIFDLPEDIAAILSAKQGG